MTAKKKNPPPRSSSGPHGDLVRLGRVTGPFGILGEVRIFLEDPESDWLFEPRAVVLVGPAGERRDVVMTARPGGGKRILAAIDGLGDREIARALMGWEIHAPRQALPPLEDGEYYVRDLLGRPVVDHEGRPLGRLADVHQGGPVEVWEIAGEGGTWYLPILEGRVVGVESDRIVVRDPLPRDES